MRIIVNGSEGNIGSKLVPYLRHCGHEVLRSDIAQNYAKDYIKADITAPIELYEAAYEFKPQVVFHLAGMVSRITCEKAPALTINTNVVGTANIIELCKMVGAKLINYSTSEVYGNFSHTLNENMTPLWPNNIYGLSKLIAENIVQYHVDNDNLKAVTLRLFMIYDEDETLGEHRSAMIRFAQAIVNEENITVHKDSMRSWLHIDDAVIAMEKAIYVESYKIINIGHPDVIPVFDIAKLMCELADTDESVIKIKKLPPQMTLVKRPSLERQKKLLDFTPAISIKEGVGRVINAVEFRYAK